MRDDDTDEERDDSELGGISRSATSDATGASQFSVGGKREWPGRWRLWTTEAEQLEAALRICWMTWRYPRETMESCDAYVRVKRENEGCPNG